MATRGRRSPVLLPDVGEALPFKRDVETASANLPPLGATLHHAVREEQLLAVDEELPRYLRTQWPHLSVLLAGGQHLREVVLIDEGLTVGTPRRLLAGEEPREAVSVALLRGPHLLVQTAELLHRGRVSLVQAQRPRTRLFKLHGRVVR